MGMFGRLAGAVGIGAGFGLVTAVVNRSATPADAGGGPLADTVWESSARVAAKMIDSGWAWAALAVLVGRLVGTLAWSMVAGAAALLTATAGYNVTESVLRILDSAAEPALNGFVPHQTSPWSFDDMGYWGVAAVLLGPVLGLVGALTRRPGVVGLLASLTVPAGAALQMILMPPGGNLPASLQRPENGWTRAIVLTGALAVAGLFIARYVRGRVRSRGPERRSPPESPAASAPPR